LTPRSKYVINASMIKDLWCPRLEDACPQADICSVANEPLQGIVKSVRSELKAGNERIIIAKLAHELKIRSDLYGNVDLYPAPDHQGNINICPEEIMLIGEGMNVARKTSVIGIRNLALESIEATIADLPRFEG